MYILWLAPASSLLFYHALPEHVVCPCKQRYVQLIHRQSTCALTFSATIVASASDLPANVTMPSIHASGLQQRMFVFRSIMKLKHIYLLLFAKPRAWPGQTLPAPSVFYQARVNHSFAVWIRMCPHENLHAHKSMEIIICMQKRNKNKCMTNFLQLSRAFLGILMGYLS